MTIVGAILDEIRARGAVAYRRGGDVRMRPARAITPELIERVKRHKSALLEILPEAPPEVATLPATAPAADSPAWIVSSSSDGDMRLIVASPPPWPAAVLETAVLVELIDHHHRSGEDARADSAAERLEVKLAELRSEGTEAWLAS